jgi:hypothetical protein
MYGVDDDGVIFRRDTRAARRSERYDLNRAGTTASVSPPNLRYGARRHDRQAGAACEIVIASGRKLVEF